MSACDDQQAVSIVKAEGKFVCLLSRSRHIEILIAVKRAYKRRILRNETAEDIMEIGLKK